MYLDEARWFAVKMSRNQVNRQDYESRSTKIIWKLSPHRNMRYSHPLVERREIDMGKHLLYTNITCFFLCTARLCVFVCERETKYRFFLLVKRHTNKQPKTLTVPRHHIYIYITADFDYLLLMGCVGFWLATAIQYKVLSLCRRCIQLAHFVSAVQQEINNENTSTTHSGLSFFIFLKFTTQLMGVFEWSSFSQYGRRRNKVRQSHCDEANQKCEQFLHHVSCVNVRQERFSKHICFCFWKIFATA